MDSHSFSLLDPDPRRKKNTEKCKEIGVADPDPVALFCLILDNNLFMFGSGHNHPITCNIICPVSGPVISKLQYTVYRYGTISSALGRARLGFYAEILIIVWLSVQNKLNYFQLVLLILIRGRIILPDIGQQFISV